MFPPPAANVSAHDKGRYTDLLGKLQNGRITVPQGVRLAQKYQLAVSQTAAQSYHYPEGLDDLCNRHRIKLSHLECLEEFFPLRGSDGTWALANDPELQELIVFHFRIFLGSGYSPPMLARPVPPERVITLEVVMQRVVGGAVYESSLVIRWLKALKPVYRELCARAIMEPVSGDLGLRC